MNLIECIKTCIFVIVSNNQNLQHTFWGVETMYFQLIMVIGKSPCVTFLKNSRNNATRVKISGLQNQNLHKKFPKLAKSMQVFQQIHVFLKKSFTMFWVSLQPILRYIWNGNIYNVLTFLIKSTLWQVIKIAIMTIKTSNIKRCWINVT